MAPGVHGEMGTSANDGGRYALLARRAWARTARLTGSVTELAERGQRLGRGAGPGHAGAGSAPTGCAATGRPTGSSAPVLLAAYFFLTVLPVTVVQATYVSGNPEAFANRIARRLERTAIRPTF